MSPARAQRAAEGAPARSASPRPWWTRAFTREEESASSWTHGFGNDGSECPLQAPWTVNGAAVTLSLGASSLCFNYKRPTQGNRLPLNTLYLVAVSPLGSNISFLSHLSKDSKALQADKEDKSALKSALGRALGEG